MYLFVFSFCILMMSGIVCILMMSGVVCFDDVRNSMYFDDVRNSMFLMISGTVCILVRNISNRKGIINILKMYIRDQ